MVCERSQRLQSSKPLHPQIFSVLDAKRDKDGNLVCIKRIKRERTTDEVKIGTYLSTEPMLRDPTNHCVPIWDSFHDPILPKVEYIVMPNLRPYNDPEFHFIGEVVDFASQVLEVSALVSHEQRPNFFQGIELHA